MNLIESRLNKWIVSFVIVFSVAFPEFTASQTIEPIKFGDFNQWVTRNIKESAALGGQTKKLYEVGPTSTLNGNNPYKSTISPWGTSNVMGKVCGIVKGSNAVFPAVRNGSDKCVKMCTILDHVKVLGIVNMEVLVAGTLFTGYMLEPVSSTKNPYSKMNMGMAYTKKPKALVFDYKVDMPNTNKRIKSTGFSSKKELNGHDNPVVFVFLQKRWEDESGNIHAVRVGTGGRKFTQGSGWVNGYKLPIVYGDISSNPGMGWLKLRSGSNSYHAKNSKGKMKPINEEGYDANATPTHVIIMMSAGDGEPYVGTEGLNFYVDNVGFQL